MININNLQDVLIELGYEKINDSKFQKKFKTINCQILVDFENKKIIYPEDKGFKITRRTTCNFADKENFVVLECITRLFDKGYRPENIEIEREWSLGHNKKSGYADIVVNDIDGKTLFIIECKTPGTEYKKEKTNILNDGGQLFSYWQQERNCKWLILYASDFINNKVEYVTDSINCSDDENIKNISKKDEDIKIYEKAKTVDELFEVWAETYESRFSGDVIFRDDSVAYKIGVKPLRKKDLVDFLENNKVVNKFEEILRHNNVSDKENAFNRLIALFICKLVDEIKKDNDMEVDFQYKVGTDTFESLQDRLQRLHKEGMKDFMDEEIFYVPDDYADKLVQSYTGHKRKKMIEDLKENLRKLKFYTNNDFAFKDVHNEELFYQNGRILIEVIQLFEGYRITGSNNLQMLGDLFEQLLNKGFKQNEGQFFTPMPITKFIWECIPLSKIMEKDGGIEYPKTIDFACGAGHFLTQAYDSINEYLTKKNIKYIKDWETNKLYGIEKDYRLARVSKISLFMHGAGKGNIKFGDGLENYKELNIKSNSFDILVANPPYSVSSFKPYLKLKDNEFEVLKCISNNGSEIETLFVERMTQLLKPCGICAIILPSTILNKTNESFVKARELILENFKVRTIVTLGSKTFGATGTNTVILFLEKFDSPPKRTDLVIDIVDSIFEDRDLKSWIDNDIIESYIDKIVVEKEDYINFITRSVDYLDWKDNSYFKRYLQKFNDNINVKNKRKQASFKKSTISEQKEWFNNQFYNYSHNIEKEKLKYFALAFGQNTLIVQSPNDSKEQEEFLGYKWSNRKGQEGIQIINYGGILFDGSNSGDENTISNVIKNQFCSKRIYNEKEGYYYYQKLTDMLDVDNVNFSKTINTKKMRNEKLKPGYKEFKLRDDDFTLSIGNRVVDGDELIKKNGLYPIYSANVYEEMARTDEIINKDDINKFDKPSIIWGIDGDWGVNYIDEQIPFYPTDHCGVLRVKNENILPEYIRFALEVEGKFERFSRSNRASIDRVGAISIHIPDSKVLQQEIVNEINSISIEINSKKNKINELSDKIQNKFNEMFVNKKFKTMQLYNLYDIQLGKTPSRQKPEYWNEKTYKWISVADMGKYDRYTNQTAEYISELALSKTNIKIVPKNTVLMSFKLTIGRTAITSEDIYTNEAIAAFLPKIKEISSNDYLRIWLFRNDWSYGQMNAVKGITLNKESIGKVYIPIPPKKLQDEFDNYVNEIEELKEKIYSEILDLNADKKKIIIKHFE